jgi:hypothetical protein
MIQMAEETGGKAYYDTNGVGQSAVDAIASGSNYYTLGYVPMKSKEDGLYRKIKVHVEGGPYQLAYRRGYYAEVPGAPGKSVPPRFSPMGAAMVHGTPELSQVLFEVRVLPKGDAVFSGPRMTAGQGGESDNQRKDGMTRYVIDYVIDGRSLAMKDLPDGLKQSELEIAQAVYTPDGVRVKDSDLGLQIELKPKDGTPNVVVRQEIDVPSKAAFLRMGVRDSTTGTIGTVEIGLNGQD